MTLKEIVEYYLNKKHSNILLEDENDIPTEKITLKQLLEFLYAGDLANFNVNIPRLTMYIKYINSLKSFSKIMYIFTVDFKDKYKVFDLLEKFKIHEYVEWKNTIPFIENDGTISKKDCGSSIFGNVWDNYNKKNCYFEFNNDLGVNFRIDDTSWPATSYHGILRARDYFLYESKNSILSHTSKLSKTLNGGFKLIEPFLKEKYPDIYKKILTYPN